MILDKLKISDLRIGQDSDFDIVENRGWILDKIKNHSLHSDFFLVFMMTIYYRITEVVFVKRMRPHIPLSLRRLRKIFTRVKPKITHKT